LDEELAMQNVIIIEPEHVPVEQIAYIETFEPPVNGEFKPDKPYKGRVVLLNREPCSPRARRASSPTPTAFICSLRTTLPPIR
jgi:hypothetical protein